MARDSGRPLPEQVFRILEEHGGVIFCSPAAYRKLTKLVGDLHPWGIHTAEWLRLWGVRVINLKKRTIEKVLELGQR